MSSIDNKSKTALKAAGAAVAMFAFGFMLVPIYDTICEITGLNGKTGTISITQVEPRANDDSRVVTVEFLASLNRMMPLDFEPVVKKMQVTPGRIYTMDYIARNLTSNPIQGQAVPSLAPVNAAIHFDKVECFCFSEQAFKPGEERRLPVQFVISTKLPDNVKTVSLSYTFFEITDKQQDKTTELNHV